MDEKKFDFMKSLLPDNSIEAKRERIKEWDEKYEKRILIDIQGKGDGSSVGDFIGVNQGLKKTKIYTDGYMSGFIAGLNKAEEGKEEVQEANHYIENGSAVQKTTHYKDLKGDCISTIEFLMYKNIEKQNESLVKKNRLLLDHMEYFESFKKISEELEKERLENLNDKIDRLRHQILCLKENNLKKQNEL